MNIDVKVQRLGIEDIPKLSRDPTMEARFTTFYTEFVFVTVKATHPVVALHAWTLRATTGTGGTRRSLLILHTLRSRFQKSRIIDWIFHHYNHGNDNQEHLIPFCCACTWKLILITHENNNQHYLTLRKKFENSNRGNSGQRQADVLRLARRE